MATRTAVTDRTREAQSIPKRKHILKPRICAGGLKEFFQLLLAILAAGLIFVPKGQAQPPKDLNASEQEANPTAPIAWSEIGAKAGAQYQGDGLSLRPTDAGATLHCVFQKLEAEATVEGLWLISTRRWWMGGEYKGAYENPDQVSKSRVAAPIE